VPLLRALPPTLVLAVLDGELNYKLVSSSLSLVLFADFFIYVF